MFSDLQVNIDGGLDLPLPDMVQIRQQFDSRRLDDVGGAVARELEKPEIAERIRPGARIAVGVGSRGVANIAEAVAALIAGLKARGAEPFVFPAMGSHGGATAEGQIGVLANYGVTEAGVGAPIRATMDTVCVGELDDGTPLHVDRYAHDADGVVVINRIKPHTTFRGAVESGLIKMLVIGMGKIRGATIMHSDHGMDRFPQVLPPAAQGIMDQVPVLFGVGLVEDAYDATAIVEAVPAERLLEREPALLEQAKALMARIYFSAVDVLIIDRMGKEISGSGFDPNVTGRNNRGVDWSSDPQVSKIVVLDLSDATHGNATGIGLADVITQRLFERIDFATTYANVITSAYLDGGLIPLVMKNERDAVSLAVKTLTRVKPHAARIVRIKDTLHLGEIAISTPLLDEAHRHPRIEVLSEPAPLALDG